MSGSQEVHSTLCYGNRQQESSLTLKLGKILEKWLSGDIWKMSRNFIGREERVALERKEGKKRPD
jgi:hypothetical protein